MSLTNTEKLILEELTSLLQSKAQLGLAFHKEDQELVNERGYEYLHRQIDEMFAHKAAELIHFGEVNAVFRKVHDYKYLNDPTFVEAMERDMRARGVPANERQEANKIIEEIINELSEEQKEWAEKDFGYNKHLDEITEISQPPQYSDDGFEIITGLED